MSILGSGFRDPGVEDCGAFRLDGLGSGKTCIHVRNCIHIVSRLVCVYIYIYVMLACMVVFWLLACSLVCLFACLLVCLFALALGLDCTGSVLMLLLQGLRVRVRLHNSSVSETVILPRRKAIQDPERQTINPEP